MAKLAYGKYIRSHSFWVVIGLLAMLVFLGPSPAIGLSVGISIPTQGGAIQPTFAQGEDVPITAQVDLEGKEETITSAVLEIRRAEGDSAFTDIRIDLPVEQGTFVTGSPPGGIDESTVGSAFVNVNFRGVMSSSGSMESGSNTAYEGGIIAYSILYVPPEVGGDYSASVNITTPEETRISSVGFIVSSSSGGGLSPLLWIIPLIVGGSLLILGGAILAYVRYKRGI